MHICIQLLFLCLCTTNFKLKQTTTPRQSMIVLNIRVGRGAISLCLSHGACREFVSTTFPLNHNSTTHNIHRNLK